VPPDRPLPDRVAQGQPADAELDGEIALGREPLARPDNAELYHGQQPLDGLLERVSLPHRAQQAGQARAAGHEGPV
jgi:hypothetical protein